MQEAKTIYKRQEYQEYNKNTRRKMESILYELSIKEISRVLSLLDKNRLSPTYGSFDRNFWQYKIIDFPSGMAQCLTLSLALVYSNPYNKNNQYYQNPLIREYIIAGIRYLEKCSHKDGSCDEFYPYERALGAMSFSLYAVAESYKLLGLDDKSILDMLTLKADWIIKNVKADGIANHMLGAALAVAKVGEVTKNTNYYKNAKTLVEYATSTWVDEGWFYEYDGCDPGYSTFSIDFMSKYYEITKDKTVLPYIEKSINFISTIIATDGSIGGPIGSRNTWHFYLYGFEYMSKEFPIAKSIVQAGIKNFKAQEFEYMNDDRYFFYYVNNNLQTLNIYQKPGSIQELKDIATYYPKAGFYIKRSKGNCLIISLKKGGVIQLYKDNKLIFIDAGFIGKLGGKVVSTQIIDSVKIKVEENKISIVGNFHKINYEYMNTYKLLVFRIVLSIIGRFWGIGHYIKKYLVKRLITRKNKSKIRYLKEISIQNYSLNINTTILLPKDNKNLSALFTGTNFNCIQVPTSKYHHYSDFLEWANLSNKLEELNKKRKVNIEVNI